MVKIQKSIKNTKRDMNKKEKKDKKINKKNMAIEVERREFVEEVLSEN
ncbi:MAG: hypothetical protein QXE05_10740 [Nitrososphaeria archaeon]